MNFGGKLLLAGLLVGAGLFPPAMAQEREETERLEFSSEMSGAFVYALATYLGESGKSQINLVAAEVDLNGDGRMDLIAHVDDPYFCGTAGCPPDVFISNKKGWKLASVNGLAGSDNWFIHFEKKNGFHLLARLLPDRVLYYEWNGVAYVLSDESPGLDGSA